MGDGFSDPTPAETEGDAGPDLDLDEDAPALSWDGEQSCANCAARDVCVIRQGFGEKLAQEYGDDDERTGPVNPNDLAVICSNFIPDTSGES